LGESHVPIVLEIRAESAQAPIGGGEPKKAGGNQKRRKSGEKERGEAP